MGEREKHASRTESRNPISQDVLVCKNVSHATFTRNKLNKNLRNALKVSNDLPIMRLIMYVLLLLLLRDDVF